VNRSKSSLLAIYQAAVKAVSPEVLFKKQKIAPPKNPLLIGSGKASVTMANAYAKLHQLSESNGCVVIPESSQSNGKRKKSLKFEGILAEGSHPIPSEHSVQAAKTLLSVVKSKQKDQEVIFFLSGGSSSIFEMPVPEIGLRDLRNTTEFLLHQGAAIGEINIVRKHLSRVKGGRLAEFLGESRCTTFVLSDVEGDRLDIIGSAPTYPDSSTYQDALSVLQRLKSESKIPRSVYHYLRDGARKVHPETLKPDNPVFKHYSWHVIGNASKMVAGAKKKAEALNFRVMVEPHFLKGEARVLGWWLAQRGKKARGPVLIIAAGEPTVRVMGKGKGGRCQEVALSFLTEAAGSREMVLLAAGSDGIDGPTDAAGAMASNESFERAKALDLNPEAYLQDNNSYPFFKQLGDLIITGPTGTNVNDLFLLWVPG